MKETKAIRQGDKRMQNMMKAAIFDMDGTLIDSMEQWRSLNASFLREQGVSLSRDQEEDLRSMTGRMVVDYAKENFGVETSFDLLVSRALKAMEPLYLAGMPLKPGAREYLQRLGARGVKRVLFTATHARLALIALNRMELTRELDYIICTDMLGGSKSDPAMFDRVCGIIGEKNGDCVMFEDAVYAMRGARAAGLGVIGITDETNVRDREDIRAVCDRVIDSYDEME